jgi:hypothetical protein
VKKFFIQSMVAASDNQRRLAMPQSADGRVSLLSWGRLSRRDGSAAGGTAPYCADLQLRAVLLELEQQEN